MDNISKLQKALESIDDMTDSEYAILYQSAKQADDNLVSIENYDEIIARHTEFKKMLMQYKEQPTIKEQGCTKPATDGTRFSHAQNQTPHLQRVV